jgi:hypothetical protein
LLSGINLEQLQGVFLFLLMGKEKTPVFLHQKIDVFFFFFVLVFPELSGYLLNILGG